MLHDHSPRRAPWESRIRWSRSLDRHQVCTDRRTHGGTGTNERQADKFVAKASEMEAPPQIVGDTVGPSADILVEEPALEKTWKFLL